MTITASLDALKKAVEFEREGMKYYSAAAEKAQNPATKGLFNMLVEEEEKHERFLTTLKENLKAQDKWPSEITIDLDKDFKLIFKDESARIDANVQVSTQETEALRFAFKMENRGQAMYQELSEKATNPDEKALYARLAKWEEAHAAYCEDYLNFFQDHGMFTED